MKAIAQNCLSCQGGSSLDVTECQTKECSLWNWRPIGVRGTREGGRPKIGEKKKEEPGQI